jgi:hypothetical protein
MNVLAALPHLLKVVDFGHSLQFSFLHLFLQLLIVISFRGIQCSALTRQFSVIGSSIPLYHVLFPQHIARGILLSPVNIISPMGEMGHHFDTI